MSDGGTSRRSGTAPGAGEAGAVSARGGTRGLLEEGEESLGPVDDLDASEDGGSAREAEDAADLEEVLRLLWQASQAGRRRREVWGLVTKGEEGWRRALRVLRQGVETPDDIELASLGAQSSGGLRAAVLLRRRCEREKYD